MGATVVGHPGSVGHGPYPRGEEFRFPRSLLCHCSENGQLSSVQGTTGPRRLTGYGTPRTLSGPVRTKTAPAAGVPDIPPLRAHRRERGFAGIDSTLPFLRPGRRPPRLQNQPVTSSRRPAARTMPASGTPSRAGKRGVPPGHERDAGVDPEFVGIVGAMLRAGLGVMPEEVGAAYETTCAEPAPANSPEL